MTMITPSYLGETIEYSSLHACRSTLEDPTRKQPRNTHSKPHWCRVSNQQQTDTFRWRDTRELTRRSIKRVQTALAHYAYPS